jgi:hypothetical protein
VLFLINKDDDINITLKIIKFIRNKKKLLSIYKYGNMFRLSEPSSVQITNHIEDDDDDDDDKLFAGGIFVQIMLIHNRIYNISKVLINLT